MDKKNYAISAQALFDFLCNRFGYNWTEIMNRKNISGTLGEIHVQREMFDMYKHIQAGDGFLAWQQGISILKDMIDNWNGWNTSEDLRSHAKFLQDAAGFLDNYNGIREDDRKDWLVKLRSMLLLTAEEKQQDNLTDNCPRSMNDDVDAVLMNKRLLRICRYKGNTPLRMENIKSVNVGENFIMANNVGQIIMQGKNGKPDELNVYVSLNIDDILDFSYFLLAFNNGENWWLVTDEPEFANPGAKEGIANRGSFRYRRDDYDNTIFPYIFLDRILEWREENRQVDRPDSVKREMYTVPLTDWPVQCRVFLNLLMERLFLKFQEDDGQLQQVKFGYEFSHALLLENKDYKADDWKSKNDKFDYADKNTNSQKRIESMIFGDEECRSLVPVTSSQLTDKISVWNGSLMTEDKFAKLEAWALCDIEYKRKKKLLEKVEEGRKADENRMWRMLDANFHKRIETLFAAREMSVFIYEPDMKYEGADDAFNPFRSVYMMNIHAKGKSFYMMDIPGKVGGTTENLCKRCGKYPLKQNHTSVLYVYHYAFLAWLAGVKREQLPLWYANYTSHVYNEYCGNHLLSNVNPIFLLKDVLSARRPNGLTFYIRVCQRCRTAMEKAAMDKGVLVINKLTCEAEGVFSVDDFKEWLQKKEIQSANINTIIHTF